VQIVRTPDGRLAGRLEEIGLSADGNTKDTTIALEGAADGGQIVLSPKSLLLSGDATSMTGFIDGDLLDLSWQGGHASLKRADAHAFEVAVTVLKARSAMILADQRAKARVAEHAAQIQHLLASTQTLSDSVAQLHRNVPVIEQELAKTRASYEQLQVESSHDRRRQKAFAMSSALGLQSMKAGTDAQAADVQLEAVHRQGAELEAAVEQRITAARQTAATAQLYCRVLVGSPEPAIAQACGEVRGQNEEIGQIELEMGAAFNATEDAFQHPKQYVPIGRRLISGLFQ
jgi:hypothetical protein